MPIMRYDECTVGMECVARMTAFGGVVRSRLVFGVVPVAMCLVLVSLTAACHGRRAPARDTAPQSPPAFPTSGDRLSADLDLASPPTLFGLAVEAVAPPGSESVFANTIAISAPIAASASGSNGRILIIRLDDGSVQTVIDAPASIDWFGTRMLAIRIDKARVALGIQGGFAPRDLVIVDPSAKTPIAVVAKVDALIGKQHDQNGDGCDEFVVSQVRGGNWFVSVISARNGKLLREFAVASSPTDMTADFDTDGAFDLIGDQTSDGARAPVYSGLHGAELAMLTLVPAYRLPYGRWSPFVARTGKAGREHVSVVLEDDAGSARQLVKYTVGSGSVLATTQLERVGDAAQGVSRLPPPWRAFACGDLDRDGTDDLLIAELAAFNSELNAFSGATGRLMWSAEDVVVADYPSVTRLWDVDADSVGDLCVGRVLYLGDGPQYGANGQVTILSGANGRRLRTFDERSYAKYLQ